MECSLVNKNITKNYTEELLKERGVENVELFLKPDKSCLQTPEALINIEKGAELFLSKVDKGQKIFLVADCDVDGMTSAAIIYLYIKENFPDTEIVVYIHEGKQHGLEDCYELILDTDGIDLVIAPDSASNDKVYADEIGEAGIPILVLDHHEVDQEISDSMVVINNQISPDYKNKDLTGAGVTFQFCRYIDKLLSRDTAFKYIDLAALGICGDMGSLLQLENRYFMVEGFSHIENYFLKTLIAKQSYSMNNTVNPTTVAFFIVPLINAIIRVGTMEEKERLFLAFVDGHKKVSCHKRGAQGTLEEVAVESTRECVNARTRQNKIKEKAMESLEIQIQNNDLLNNKILVVEVEDEDEIPSELTGLVAMGLLAKHKKPTIVVRLGADGNLKGSIRGPSNTALDSFKDFLLNSNLVEFCAGHAMAAGTGFKKSNLLTLIEYANNELANVDFGESWYDVNFVRYSNDKDLKEMVFDLAQHEDLWGQNNSQPLIDIKGINLNRNELQVIGSKKDTIKFEKNGIVYIKFHAIEMIKDLEKFNEMSLEVVGHANINEWGGRCTPQIFIDNYEVRDSLFGF